MKGYKNSTKTVYETESSANYAKGGKAMAKVGKAMAKVGKVMGEFKRGTLHSGSKKGPEVKSPKQAIAIALNEARGAGAKIPMRKAEGGAVKKAKTSDPFAREGIESRTSWDDRNAGRFGKPGTAQQVPAEDYVITMPGGSDGNWREVARGSMNYGGVSGGMPSKSAKSLKSRAKMYEEDGASASASAARTRARNVEGHEAMTRKSMKEIKRSQLKAKADAPGASFYDKARSVFAEKTGYAEGGKVKAPPPKAKTYDPVKDEPTSRPLTADQVRNLRNQMKANPPKKPAKRPYDPVLDEPTSRPFKTGGYVKKQEGGLMAERQLGAREMVGKAKGGAVAAVHKHERNMHPGKPLTKMRYGGKVGC